MADVATHVRIFEPDPSDDFVTKRLAIVDDLADKFIENNDVDALISIVQGIANACLKGGSMPESLTVLVEAAVREQSTSFVRTGNELQLLALAMLALDKVIAGAEPDRSSISIYDLLAFSTWLALGFQPVRAEPKIEALRSELLGNARSLCLRSAARSRERLVVDDIKLDKFAQDSADAAPKLTAAINPPIHALQENAILDREEIDFLWWALSDYSTLAEARLSTLSPPVAALAAGVEAAEKLRRIPAEAHKHIVLRHVRQHPPLTLSGLIENIGANREIFASTYENASVRKFPEVFGLLAALDQGQAAKGPAEKLSLEDWAVRALLEAGLLHIVGLLPGAKV
ncbi:hypothetical protein DES32_0785 [Methylovirgula ligni]|uniref:GTPase-associated system helical domain-containing protein n=1 Tax=Methylovirgula ligni TaxID=569860 RepID=A0A3D9Z5N5_9HYPH|nr:GTPase-associated system all-helical protein GASH [Methylovirgula ligni]REF89560.1 hypothetical protein DES32_0785 [Methylovirgula ligni]